MVVYAVFRYAMFVAATIFFGSTSLRKNIGTACNSFRSEDGCGFTLQNRCLDRDQAGPVAKRIPPLCSTVFGGKAPL